MATVVVYDEKGSQVWQMHVDSHAIRNLECPGNVTGSSLASGIRRAVEDAEVIEAGGDPERPSEKAMRLADAEMRDDSQLGPPTMGDHEDEARRKLHYTRGG